MKYYLLNSVLVSIITCLFIVVFSVLFSEQLIHLFGGVTDGDVIELKQRLRMLETRTRHITTKGLATIIQAGPHQVICQEDGNFVIYNRGGHPIWSTRTNQPLK